MNTHTISEKIRALAAEIMPHDQRTAEALIDVADDVYNPASLVTMAALSDAVLTYVLGDRPAS